MPKETFETITRTYMDDLAAMGYTQPWREKVLVSTTKGYCRRLKKCSEGATRRSRKGADMFVKRRFAKLCGNSE